MNPSDLRMVNSLGNVVVRFLAGICKHDDYEHSHPKYKELLQLLASNIKHKIVCYWFIVHSSFLALCMMWR